MLKKNQWFLNGWILPILYLFGRIVIYLGFVSSGLNGAGDLPRYFEISSLRGLPFFSYWVEYPPVFPFLNTLVFHLASDSQFLYDFILYFLLALFGAACIYIFSRIANVLWGEEIGNVRSILYFALLLPLSYTWWYFEPIPVALMLAGFWYVNRGKANTAGGWIGLGILTKWFPVLLLPAVWRYRPWREAAKITIISLVLTAIIFAGLWIASPAMTSASLASQPVRNSWQTVWAWLDGNFMTGAIASPENHYDANYVYDLAIGNPPVISPWIRLVLFGLIGLYLFWKVKVKNFHSLISFVGITWAIFLLWSSGWSPQWILYLIPLILLTFPVQKALFWNFILILLALLEWPMLLGHRLWTFMGPIAMIRSIILIVLVIIWYRFTQKEYQEPP